MKFGVICNDPRLNQAIGAASKSTEADMEFISHENYFYPSVEYLQFDKNFGQFITRGKYFEQFLRSMYRDLKFSWRYLDTDAEFWYLGIKNSFIEILEKYDAIIFNNVPHEGLDILLAELAEDLGLSWFAPLQCMNGSPAFQIFTNGFKQIQNNSEIKLEKPETVQVGVRLQKENTKVVENFQNNIVSPPIFEKFIDRLHRAHRRWTKEHINDIIHISPNYGLIALHMQPELNTEPITGHFANPITWIETVIKAFPDIHWVVKEHPDPSTRYRGKYFQSYLRQNISQKRISYLNANAKIVFDDFKVISTLNGTIGVEALSSGIPVVCHSTAFYSDADGVVLLDKIDSTNDSHLIFPDPRELFTRQLFVGLTDPYLSSQYGDSKVSDGWIEFINQCLQQLNK